MLVREPALVDSSWRKGKVLSRLQKPCLSLRTGKTAAHLQGLRVTAQTEVL